jgi:hypothetical protein
LPVDIEQPVASSEIDSIKYSSATAWAKDANALCEVLSAVGKILRNLRRGIDQHKRLISARPNHLIQELYCCLLLEPEPIVPNLAEQLADIFDETAIRYRKNYAYLVDSLRIGVTGPWSVPTKCSVLPGISGFAGRWLSCAATWEQRLQSRRGISA